MSFREFELHYWYRNIEKQQSDVGLIFVFRFFAFRFSLFVFRFLFLDIRFESENPILIFKILFWHSHWVGKSYFVIQNPILTFALSRKILFCHLKSYFDIRTESENQNPILTFTMSRKILFSHSYWVGKFCFNTGIRYESENPILTFKLLFWHSRCQNRILNVKIGLFDS